MPNFVSPDQLKKLDGLDVYQNTLKSSSIIEYAKIPFWKVLLLDLLTKVDIWQTDKDGNIEYTDKGYPKVNIVKLMFNLGKVIAYIVTLIQKANITQRL